MNRSRNAHLLTAATLLASMPMHVARVASAQGDDVLVIGGDGSIPVKEESDMERMSREVTEQIARGPKPNVKQPNPEVQAAAEAKRARKAARLKQWADKGAIGVQEAIISAGGTIGSVQDKLEEGFLAMANAPKKPRAKKTTTISADPAKKAPAKKRAPKKASA